MNSLGLDGCLYAATAPPPPETHAATGNATADLAIVGGGFTGLSAALHAAERGVDAVLLEAGEIGAGASGRNHGHCVPVARFASPEAIHSELGAERGAAFVSLFTDGGREVFDLIARLGIDCEAAPTGTLEVAHSAEALPQVMEQCARYEALGKAVRRLGREEVAALTGSTRYAGGWIHPEGGHLNPLAYCRGLARAALRAGARIHTDTPALAIAREGEGWAITTPAGTVRAARVAIATNAHTGALWPGLRQSFFTMEAYGLASEPVDAALRQRILPGNHNVGDSRPDVHFYRFDRDNRLIVGGLVEHVRGRDAERTTALMRRRVAWLFPELADIAWRFFWRGRLAINRDMRPHLYAPAPGLVALIGYSGRGVPFATPLGRMLADWAAGAPLETLPLPVSPIRPMAMRTVLSVTVPRLRGPLKRLTDRRRAHREGREPAPA